MKCKLKDIAEINPRETLAKGRVAKKVSMDLLSPFCRDITGYTLEPFSGGTKFRNGDTLMARITPCLENGKRAKVTCLDYGEVGFGSTEYIVFRAKRDVADEDYLYYLICSPTVRDTAIKSMVGTSGRQRVQSDVVENIEIDLPPLPEQKRIAAILSSLDDKIENNKRINRHLEQMAQALFKSWFVDFAPFGGKVPKDWKSASLGDAFIFQRGVGITKNDVVPIRDRENPYVVYGAGREMFGYSKKFLLKEPSVLVAAIGAGAGTVSRSHEAKYSVTSNVFYVTVRNPYEYPYAIYALKRFDFIGRCSGSAQPMLAYGAFATDEILIPSEPVLRAFNELCAPLIRLVDLNLQNVTSLAYLRDMLLPRLMSGKIALADTSIEQ